ncbi:hypothetical protein MASR2M18_10580 [Ignavibacteria bacterium]|nr:T9SS type A sorting domain-containing protein [Bacteroidota bacterium]MCZ2133483.1 T9SS type A sorting domain-containing protein [Bacteroidota bacterium]
MKSTFIFRAFFGIICLLTVGVFYGLSAQTIDSKGTEFWLTFPPNYHNNGDFSNDSLYIFIVADEPTTGEIKYRNKSGKEFTHNFNIPDISKVYTFGILWTNIELSGYNDNGTILDNNSKKSQHEITALQSFHITSQKSIGVYALEQAVTTSEAFLVLPKPALGKEYYVIAYNCDGRSSGGFGSIDGNSTPSQFAIVAAEDNTGITIRPKVPTRRFGMSEQQITLNKGDVYLVQADMSSKLGYQNDLTGTHVKSTKPVAIFGGQQRTKLPVENPELTSRDCIIEQIPPLTTWGKSYLLTPYPQPSGATTIGNDIYRVVAAQDSTVIYLNGTKLTTLQRGGVYQGQLTVAGEITSPNPILVAQYKKTSTESSASNSTQYGDPFMMILPPTEQFLDFYRFINAESYDEQNPNGVYKNYEYATVIAPTSDLTSVKFDNQPVPPSSFTRIGATSYSYAQIKTTVGSHTVKCEKPIGLLVYGYGRANSYGYVGGMSYRPINKKMPELILSNDCFERKIIAPGVYDGGNRIASIILDTTVPTENLDITLPTLPPTRDSAHFSISLRDKYLDGSCGIIVVDTLGFQGKTKIDICGFTVGITAPGATVSSISDYYPIVKKFNTGRIQCVDIDLVNYGKCEQIITNIKTAAGQNGIIAPNSFPPMPVTLGGGQRQTLRLCIFAATDGDYTDTISIATSCGLRNVLVLDVQARADKNPPTISKNGDPCLTTFDARITDSLDFDSGLEFAAVIDSINCSAVPITSNSHVYSYKISVKDPYQDAFFTVSARDSAGNSTIIRDTIPGFTMQIRSLSNVEPPTLDYGVTASGVFVCDSLELYNYGSYPLTFNNIELDVNIVFSIPQSQLPFVIMPKESRKLAVCYTPVSARKVNPYDSVGLPDKDGFGLNFRCLTRRILLKGTPSDIYRDGDSRCQLPVYTISDRVAPHYYLDDGYPNPSNGIVRFGFDVPIESDIRIVLTDISGIEQFVILEGHFPAGHFIGDIPTDRLAPGVYFYRMTAGGELLARPIIVK